MDNFPLLYRLETINYESLYICKISSLIAILYCKFQFLADGTSSAGWPGRSHEQMP
jgi:hypothetical protein